MARFQQHLNIANFICKFGEQKVLLDFGTEIVIPAFTENLTRKYADTSYFFHQVEIVDLGNDGRDEIAIAGRFVKQTKIARDQVFADGNLVKDHRELDSAPASFFALLLSNHKLLYVRENSGAPSLATFGSTVESFLRVKHKKWVDAEYERRNEGEQKVTKKSILDSVPPPELNILELSSEVSIREFVKKFRTLNSVEVRLVNTNHELDNSPLFGDLREVKEAVGADRLTVKTEKSGEKGLLKDKVSRLVAKPAEDGNSVITLRGVDQAGDKLNGNNSEFKLSIPVKTLPSRVTKALHVMFEAYVKQQDAGIVAVKALNKNAVAKLSKVKNQLGFE